MNLRTTARAGLLTTILASRERRGSGALTKKAARGSTYIEKFVFTSSQVDHKIIQVDDLELELQADDKKSDGPGPEPTANQPTATPPSQGTNETRLHHCCRLSCLVCIISQRVSTSAIIYTIVAAGHDTQKTTWYHVCGNDPTSVTAMGLRFGFRDQDVNAANNAALAGPQVPNLTRLLK